MTSEIDAFVADYADFQARLARFDANLTRLETTVDTKLADLARLGEELNRIEPPQQRRARHDRARQRQRRMRRLEHSRRPELAQER
ncbi:hypothetical protein [Nocardia carnea]|uniref:hypothetical protein n=1 Tax=Nocardia carnea TaxID=37328 RepID=UPI00245778FB|nr:hypothetical protein [Nocardia carnea]